MQLNRFLLLFHHFHNFKKITKHGTTCPMAWLNLPHGVYIYEDIGSLEAVQRRMIGMTRWDGKILDYSKGGGQGAASCRLLTGLLQSPHFLCSYVVQLTPCMW